MESGPEKIEEENKKEEGKTLFGVEGQVPVDNEMLLIRRVPIVWIRKDNSITLEAYRPKKRPTETGYEKNVSTAPKTCYPFNMDLEDFNWKKHKIFEIKAQHPNNCEYPALKTSKCHVGISGDMKKLALDEDTLNLLANNSSLLYPIDEALDQTGEKLNL